MMGTATISISSQPPWWARIAAVASNGGIVGKFRTLAAGWNTAGARLP